MAVKSQISAIVATQLGKLQGELESKIQGQAFELATKFVNQCPSPEELVKIVRTLNNLLRVLNSFTRKTDKFARLPNTLTPAIQASKVLIRLLKQNPIPTATIPPSGGLGIPIGRIVSLSDRLRNVNNLLEALEDDIESLKDINQSITPSIENTRQTLNGVIDNVQQCVLELRENAEDSESTMELLNNLLKEIQPPENTGSEGIPDQSYNYIAPNGKQYVLGIIEDRRVDFPIPRRVGIARDSQGVVVIKGQPSFSSDTKVLLDEIKFRIDRQLP